MTYCRVDLHAARIAILRGRADIAIASEAGDKLLSAIINAVTADWTPDGVRKAPTLDDMRAVMLAAQAWVREALAAIDDDEAEARIDRDRAATDGPAISGAVDRLADACE
jgi:hypothetical protein